MPRSPRVIFFGNGFEYSLSFLRALAASKVKLVAIVAPVEGEGRESWASMARAWRSPMARLLRDDLSRQPANRYPRGVLEIADRTHSQIFWPKRIHGTGVVDSLEDLEADLVIMAGFNEILQSDDLKRLPPVLNVHPSLLPAFRGPHPEFWTLAHGAAFSGVTIHRVTDGIDTGPIIAQTRFEVEPWLNAGALQRRAMLVGAELLREVVEGWSAETPSWPQEGEASYQGKVSQEDLRVPFSLSSAVAYNLARAAAPWMPLRLYVPQDWWSLSMRRHTHSAAASSRMAPGLLAVDLLDASHFPEAKIGAPGTLRRTEDGGLAVACRDGVIFFAQAKSLSAP